MVKLKIVMEANVPFMREGLEKLGEVIALPADEITPDVMAETDILVTRTRTRCDAALLSGSRCRFIGTATIGTDHIDLEYCAARGITVANAPGCNAPAVAQYVMAAIKATKGGFEGLKLGIIGVGHVGSIVDRWARGLGMQTLLNDPPRFRAEGDARLNTGLDRIAAECDVITVHTPYTLRGEYATHHLLGEDFFSMAKRRPLVINAARGPIADTGAMLEAYARGLVGGLAIDCWEREPAINRDLLDVAVIATPHIAGYSRQGKIRASRMVAESLLRYLGRPDSDIDLFSFPEVGEIPAVVGADALKYDIMADTARLRLSPSTFEMQRNKYALREEPS